MPLLRSKYYKVISVNVKKYRIRCGRQTEPENQSKMTKQAEDRKYLTVALITMTEMVTSALSNQNKIPSHDKA